MPNKAIIIGAGIAGLTTGYRLKKAGWDVTVFEAAGEVGGRAVTVRRQGYIFDSGAVGIGTVYKDYMDLVAELGLSDRIVKSSTVSATVRDGRLFEIDAAKPLTGLTTKLFSWRSKLQLVNLMLDLRKLKSHLNIRDLAAAAAFDDEDSEAYARRRLNPELLEYFVEPVARTVNLTRARYVSKLELMNSLAGLLATTLVTLAGGVGIFAEKLGAGLDIRLGCRAAQVEAAEGHATVTWTTAAGAMLREQADVCVIATTLPQAMALFAPARGTYAPLTDIIEYSRGLCVHLGYKVRPETKALIVMMPPSEQAEIALFFMEHNKAPDRAPPGHAMLTVFYDDVTVERPWNLPNERLVLETQAAVERIFPELAGQLEMSHVTRWEEGLTKPVRGIYHAMRRAKLAADSGSRVQLAGDYHSTAGQNSAVASGNHVARGIIAHYPHAVRAVTAVRETI